jgi:MerR family transcriptional regulator/heat shock protein HspR
MDGGKHMNKKYWTVTEVIEIFQIDESFLTELEEEDVICPTCREDPPTKLFSCTDLEKLRFAKNLVEDMGVNLAGVEVALRMRQGMLDMRRQFDAILEDLARQLQERFQKGS